MKAFHGCVRVLLVVLAIAAAAAFMAAPAAGGDSIRTHMKTIGAQFKAIKAALTANKLDGVKDAALLIDKEMQAAKPLPPTVNAERQAELPPLADDLSAKAKDLAGATTVADARAKLTTLGRSCKACHDIFQPAS